MEETYFKTFCPTFEESEVTQLKTLSEPCKVPEDDEPEDDESEGDQNPFVKIYKRFRLARNMSRFRAAALLAGCLVLANRRAADRLRSPSGEGFEDAR